jgi:3D (Asp-Asp-Asp) domain-containing protein
MKNRNIIALTITMLFLLSMFVGLLINKPKAVDKPITISHIKIVNEPNPNTIPILEFGETPLPSCVEMDKPSTYNLGTFKITFYTQYSDGGKWGYKTATRVKSKHLATCAVDPDVIPLGSTIRIGDLELKAVDTGSEVKGNVIDIFFDGTDAEGRAWIKSFGTSHAVEVINGTK